MNTLDFIVLILLAFGGIVGFQKGLITGISRFVGKIAAIGIAVLFHTTFLNTIEPVLDLREKVEPKIGAFLAKIVAGKTAAPGQFGSTDALVQPVIGEATVVVTDYVLKIGSLLMLFFLAAFLINLLIAMIITPLAKSLGFVNRGGGLAFGVLSMLVGVCLVMGLVSPFLTTVNPDAFRVSSSIMYPWLMQGYELLLGFISAFAGDILNNPLETIPLLKGTKV